MSNVIHTNLRFPRELHEQLKALAKRDNLSINAFVIVLLREALYARLRRVAD